MQQQHPRGPGERDRPAEPPPEAPEAGDLAPPDPDKPEERPMDGNVLRPPAQGD